jgi:hypothetical protein
MHHRLEARHYEIILELDSVSDSDLSEVDALSE